MKVLLVSANTHAQPYPVYPLGLDYVAGAIENRHQVQIVDMNALGDDSALRDRIAGFTPDIIGLSIRNIDNTDTTSPKGFMADHRRLTDTIRTCSQAALVLGGSGFTIFPFETVHALAADYGIIGEGERLSVLLDALENRQDVTMIPGIVTRRSRGVIPPPWKNDIRRRFDPIQPHVAHYLEKGGMLNLQSKRGCCFNCIYCTYPHIEGRAPRLFAPEEVAETARRLQEAGAKYFFVTDSAFNSSPSHSLAVAQAFRRAGVSIPWGAFFAPVTPAEDYFRILANAGLTHVEFGTESLSDPVLRAYRKPFQSGDVIKAHNAAIDAGLYVGHYFLLGGPGETNATVDQTLERTARLDKCVLFFFCGMRIYPQTELFNIARDEGQAKGSETLLDPVFYRSTSLDSREILTRVQEKAAGQPNWIIGDGGEKTAEVLSRLYRRGHTGPLWEYLIR